MVETPNAKIHRIQLSGRELWQLRHLLVEQYHQERNNLYWSKKRVARDEPDSRVYSLEMREEHLKDTRKKVAPFPCTHVRTPYLSDNRAYLSKLFRTQKLLRLNLVIVAFICEV